jgi:purine-binding chemotaxis protein CheW
VEAAVLEVVVFELASQFFGLPAAQVHELIRAVAVVPLPRTPAVVKGVINLRGRIAPVLDLRVWFRLPAKEVEPADHFLIAQTGERLVALHVDRATNLIRLSADALKPVASLVASAKCVAWVAKAANDLVLIHDLDTFLSCAEVEVLDEPLQEERGQK